MATSIQTAIGKAELLKNNPRIIRDGQFEALTESVENFPQFMEAQKIVLWKVPNKIEKGEDEKCPFVGQEGKLVVLSGNQRVKSLLALGKKDIPTEWCCEAKDQKTGEWWSWQEAAIFLNVANSPAGVAGDFDYEKLAEFFDEAALRISGIDFSEFQGLIDEGKVKPMKGEDEEGNTPEDMLEQGEDGEKSQELQDFIAEREKTRRDLKQIDNTGFHLLCIFDSQDAKATFVAESGLCGKGGKVAGNGTNYVDLVFESEGQKMEFAEKAGLLCDDDEGDPRMMYGMFCDGRYIASKMGIELPDSGLHFRARKLDTRLAAMARDEAPQMTPEEIAQAQFEKAKAEWEAMGMPTGRYGKKKGKVDQDPKKEEEPENGEALFVSDEAFE